MITEQQQKMMSGLFEKRLEKAKPKTQEQYADLGLFGECRCEFDEDYYDDEDDDYDEDDYEDDDGVPY